MSIPDDDWSEPRELPAGQTGELQVRGPNVFQGYHNNAAATADTLSADGWLRTGDIGYQDTHGNFYITDRAKELIFKGFQVPPAELEGILVGNENVADAAVIGVEWKGLHTEVPKAYVVRSAASKTSGRLAQEEAVNIARWLDSQVASHKRLRGGVEFVDAIPKSATVKILRRVLRKKEVEKAKL